MDPVIQSLPWPRLCITGRVTKPKIITTKTYKEDDDVTVAGFVPDNNVPLHMGNIIRGLGQL